MRQSGIKIVAVAMSDTDNPYNLSQIASPGLTEGCNRFEELDISKPIRDRLMGYICEGIGKVYCILHITHIHLVFVSFARRRLLHSV
jgi:hypothetical protein